MDVKSEINHRLDQIQADENVTILYACESGSRAWGFPSTDSDFDVRFLYVHATEWYLRIRQARDVIERPIVDEIDLLEYTYLLDNGTWSGASQQTIVFSQ